MNNPGWGSKMNAVLVDRRGENEGGILGVDGVATM